jgi:hypothetical protein
MAMNNVPYKETGTVTIADSASVSDSINFANFRHLAFHTETGIEGANITLQVSRNNTDWYNVYTTAGVVAKIALVTDAWQTFRTDDDLDESEVAAIWLRFQTLTAGGAAQVQTGVATIHWTAGS